ncbi:MAG TPA: DUF4880 domain-containing protein, partial [Verrucomicrobiae bacterium]|nr:DUF4880 domain-containing protein [Verrucomicrobiae bacterium]
MPVEGSKPSAAARAAAAAWVARLHADDRTAADERAFHEWIAADPTHAAAFEMATQAYELAGALGDVPRAPLRRPVSRRAMFIGGGALAASVAAGALILSQGGAGEAYATEIGEQRRVTLVDGAELLLDTDTSVVVRDERRIEVARGQINLRLPADVAAPFEIAALDSRIVAQSGALDV